MIVNYYRNNLRDHESDEETEEDTDQEGLYYSFTHQGIPVSTYKQEQYIYVNISSDILMDFKYVIMEDGSFIYNTMEE